MPEQGDQRFHPAGCLQEAKYEDNPPDNLIAGIIERLEKDRNCARPAFAEGIKCSMSYLPVTVLQCPDKEPGTFRIIQEDKIGYGTKPRRKVRGLQIVCQLPAFSFTGWIIFMDFLIRYL